MTTSSSGPTYASADVDIDAGDRAVELMGCAGGPGAGSRQSVGPSGLSKRNGTPS